MGESQRQAEARRASRTLEQFVARVRPAAPDLRPELDLATAQVLGEFEAGGVEALLLKGPSLARALYRAPEERTYADVDLLIAPNDMPGAQEVLTRLGYRNASAALGVDDIGGVVHEESWVGTVPGGRYELVVELHFHLAGAKAAPETAWKALVTRRDWIEVAGRRVPVLARDGLALHVALHAAQHGPEYSKGVRELELALERWPQEVWAGGRRLAAEIGATDLFAGGLRLTPAGGALADRLGLPADERVDWQIRQRRVRPRGTFHLEALADARGPLARARVLRRALLPPRQWILWQHPWAHAGRGRLLAAYGVHLLRVPAWAMRAWRFRRAERAALR